MQPTQRVERGKTLAGTASALLDDWMKDYSKSVGMCAPTQRHFSADDTCTIQEREMTS